MSRGAALKFDLNLRTFNAKQKGGEITFSFPCSRINVKCRLQQRAALLVCMRNFFLYARGEKILWLVL